VQIINNHTALADQVINTLLYFEIFRHPLKSHEVFNYLRINGTTPGEVKGCLDELTERRLLFRFGDLYYLQPDHRSINRRIRGNQEAEKWLEVARKQAKLIAAFPYVRAVMASGSLSKGYMDENSDLDFFIVTAPNRLWIARTLLVLYKRVFLSNSHKKFCVNYFVDTLHLEIEEKNLFTATEIVTLIPLYNRECHNLMLLSNQWLHEYLPNFRERRNEGSDQVPSLLLKKFFEFSLNPFSLPLDRFFMWLTQRRWKRLYGKKYDKKDFDLAFKTLPYVSKNHPNNYQKKILDLYQFKVNEYTRRFGRGAHE
jgi:predicted nucleotidyltransferase